MQPTLVVREACEHNLRAVSLDLPHESLVAVSGPSGSGKTSLVLDTIYAEARRRFLAALDQGGGWRSLRVPKARRIDGLAPALALAGGLATRVRAPQWRPYPACTTCCACSSPASGSPAVSTAADRCRRIALRKQTKRLRACQMAPA